MGGNVGGDPHTNGASSAQWGSLEKFWNREPLADQPARRCPRHAPSQETLESYSVQIEMKPYFGWTCPLRLDSSGR